MAKTGLKPIERLSDVELIGMALEDNSQEAFNALYERYKRGLSFYVMKFVEDEQDVEDICIVSFLKAFRKLSTYRPANKFSTWLYTIARNTAYDHQNKEIVRGKPDRADLPTYGNREINVADDAINPEENVINSESCDLLLGCIDNLPEHYRIVAKMCFIDNMGYREIADKAAIPLNTVKTRISRAKKILIERMTELGNS